MYFYCIFLDSLLPEFLINSKKNYELMDTCTTQKIGKSCTGVSKHVHLHEKSDPVRTNPKALHMLSPPCCITDVLREMTVTRVYNKIAGSSLHHSTEKNRKLFIAPLLTSGVDVDYRNEIGQTALHVACEKGYVEIASILLSHGSNVNMTDNYGRTALLMAVDRNYPNVVSLLLDHGADGCIAESRGLAPLDVSKSAEVTDALTRSIKYNRRRNFLMFLAGCQFLRLSEQRPHRFVRESPIEKVFAIRDLHRLLTSYL